MKRATSTICALIIIGLSLNAWAGGTKIWELAGYGELDKGDLQSTILSGDGEVILGQQADKVDLTATGLVWSAVQDKQGRIYLGTGYDGKIYRVDNGKAVLIAETGLLVVTAMVFDSQGDLYVSALPERTIWKIPSPHTVNPGTPAIPSSWVTLPEGAEHIWALLFDPTKKVLYAGTGPSGQIYTIGQDQKASVYFDNEEQHILSLAQNTNGTLLAGTSPNALLLEISGPGQGKALSDFDATEVKGIVVVADGIVAGVNKFKTPPAVPSKKKNSISKNETSKPSKPKANGDGELYKIFPNGNRERLWKQTGNHVLSLAASKDNTVFAGLGDNGTVISVDKNRVVRTVLDLDEREVMVLLASTTLTFAATGDAGAAYRVSSGRPTNAFYLSPPLDAKVVAKWGTVRWFGQGSLILTARTGNTAVPDGNWSDWSSPIPNNSKLNVRSSRYVQLRFSWAKDKDALLSSTQLSFKPYNQRAIITDLDPDSPFSEGSSTSLFSSKSSSSPSSRVIYARPSSANDSQLSISWKVDNPDKDNLRFRLFYKTEKGTLWIPIFPEHRIYSNTKYTWSTETVPQGRYQLKLIADDSLSNPADDVLSDERISVPVLIDNHPPTVSKLSFKNGRIKGIAKDEFSHISAIEFSVDGNPWFPAPCTDGIFDQTTEQFDFQLPVPLTKGPHVIAVRAVDLSGNRGIGEIHIIID